MVPQTLSRALLRLSLLSVSLLLTGCPGLRDALPSMLAVTQPDSASAHEFTLLGRLGGPSTVITTVLPVVDTLHDDYVGYRIESAVLDIADLTHLRRVAFLPISLSNIALLRNDTYLADRDGLMVLPLAVPTDPVPIEQSVDRFVNLSALHAIGISAKLVEIDKNCRSTCAIGATMVNGVTVNH